MAVTRRNSRIVPEAIWSEDAYVRAQIRKQQIDMALADPQPGTVENRKGERGQQIKNSRGQTSKSG